MANTFIRRSTIAFLIVASLPVAFVIIKLQESRQQRDYLDPQVTLTQGSVERGRYVAIAADCAACHTAPGGEKPFAGGYPINTPFGQIISTNITPDLQTGIGSWNEQDFIRAVKFGKRQSGENLYPAMPYTSYNKMSDSDLHDLWAYMRSVPAINNIPPETALPFPFNFRFALTGWNMLFFHDGPFTPDEMKSKEWNRGSYLVNALAHCSVCHTQKNIMGGDSSNYLQGGDLRQWFAPDITNNRITGIGRWTREGLVASFREGQSHPVIGRIFMLC